MASPDIARRSRPATDSTGVSRREGSLPFYCVGAVFALSALGHLGLLGASVSLQALLWLTVLTLAAAADGRRGFLLTRYGTRTLLVATLLGAWVIVLGTSAVFATALDPSVLVVIGACLSPTTMWVAAKCTSGRSPSTSTGARFALAACTFWALLALIDAVTAPPGSPLPFISHERTFMAVFLLFAPFTRRYARNTIRLIVGVALLVSFAKYPSATTVIVALVGGSAFGVMRLRRFSLRVAAIVSLAGGALYLGSGADRLGSFYERFGRNDNSLTREILWSQARSLIEYSPVQGGGARLPVTAMFTQGAQTFLAPLHNSWLTIGVVGGWVAITLLAVVCIRGLACGLVVRASDGYWFPPLCAAVVTLTVNPTFDRPDTGFFFWLLVLLSSVKPKEENLR